jgi:E3 ubiquitin-protein ligase DOA10
MELFVEGEGTVTLGCNSQHILHYECICEWLDEGQTRCPVCNADIDLVTSNKV